MARVHAIKDDTYKRFVIDSGAAYFGFTDMSTRGTLMGATRGGSSFTLEQEIKDMAVDGAPGPVIGSRRVTNVKASLTVNFLEHTLVQLKQILVGSASATHAVNWDEITRALAFDSTNYISNIALIGEVSGVGVTPAMGIVLSNVICDSNLEMSLEDKEEGIITATFTAHFDPEDLNDFTDTEPWSLIWPTEA